MMTFANVRFFIFFFLCTINSGIPELLTQTIVIFEPFEVKNILPLTNLTETNVTLTGKKIFTDNVKILQKRYVQRPFVNFNDLLNQRIHGNAVPQCPCVIKPGTDKCIAYDSRYQAATIEEALVAFHDVTLDDDNLNYPTSGVINPEIFACQTLECQTCAAILFERIKKIGLIPPDYQVSIPLAEFIDPRNCRRFRFLKQYALPEPPQPSYYMTKLIERGLQYADISRQQQVIYPASRNHFWTPGQPTDPARQPVYPAIQSEYATVQPTYLARQPEYSAVQPAYSARQPEYSAVQPPYPAVAFRPSHFLQLSQSAQLPLPQLPLQLLPPPLPIAYQVPIQPQNLPRYPVQQQSGWIQPVIDASYNNEKLTIQHQTEAWEQVNEYSETKSWQQMHGRTGRKVKRQANPPILGTRYIISCVRNGEVDDENMLTLCTNCWTWRKLPPDYFPPLINELICSKESEGHCLSGWGKCEQKYRNFDVLRNVNGDWQPTTISTATCCDCRIRAGTEIHPLVVGKR